MCQFREYTHHIRNLSRIEVANNQPDADGDDPDALDAFARMHRHQSRGWLVLRALVLQLHPAEQPAGGGIWDAGAARSPDALEGHQQAHIEQDFNSRLPCSSSCMPGEVLRAGPPNRPYTASNPSASGPSVHRSSATNGFGRRGPCRPIKEGQRGRGRSSKGGRPTDEVSAAVHRRLFAARCGASKAFRTLRDPGDADEVQI